MLAAKLVGRRRWLRAKTIRLATGDDGLAQLCTMVGALVLARAMRGDPLSGELLQAARRSLAQTDC